MTNHYGLTEDGLVVPSKKDLLDIGVAGVNDRLDDNIDFDANSYYGPVLLEHAKQTGRLAEITQQIYDQRDENNAVGINLDNLYQTLDIDREPAKPSRITYQLVGGDFGTEIPEGSTVKGGGPDGELEWETVEDVVIGTSVYVGTTSDGTYEIGIQVPASASKVLVSITAQTTDSQTDVAKKLADAVNINSEVNNQVTAEVKSFDSSDPSTQNRFVITPDKGQDVVVTEEQVPGASNGLTITKGRNWVTIEALEDGPYLADTGTVDEIVTSVPGWDTTDNTADRAVPGQFKETDEDYQIRKGDLVQKPGSSSGPALEGDVLDLEFIESVTAVENNGDTDKTVDGLTVEPSHVAVVVYPSSLSDDEKGQVATRIARNVPMSTKIEDNSADVTRTVEAQSGQTKSVPYYFAAEQPIDFDINISRLGGGFEIQDVAEDIRTAIEQYIVDLLVGDDVRRLQIYDQIASVDGVVTVDLLEMRKNNNAFGTSDVSIGELHVATLGNVDVEKV